MAKKKEIDARLAEIKQLVADNKAIIGRDRVLKGLKKGTITKVFTAKNAPEDLLEDLEQYGKLSEIEHERLDTDNEELGVLCKKSFFISVIGVEQ